MVNITPIIKKNLIIVKRNITKNIFSLFYPCMYLGLLVYLLSITPGIDPTQDKGSTQPLDPMDYSNYLKDLNFPLPTKYIPNLNPQHGRVALIAKPGKAKDALKEHLIFKGKIDQNNIYEYDDIKEMNDYINRDFYKNATEITFGIELIEQNDETISFNSYFSQRDYPFTKTFDTYNLFNIYPDLPKLKKLDYINDVQMFLADFVIKYNNIAVEKQKTLKIQSIPMKSPAVIKTTTSTDQFMNLIPALFAISYISVLFQFVLWLVVEREKKLKDLLTRQGITTFQYFVSWIFTFLILMAVPLTLNCFLLNKYFFMKTNFLIIMIPMLLFSLTIIALALLFHQFVDNVRSGQSLLKLLYIGISILSIAITSETTPIIWRYLLGIFPQTILKACFELMLASVNFENGLDFILMKADYKGTNFLILNGILIFDFFFFIFLAYFVEGYRNSGVSLIKYIQTSFTFKSKVITPKIRPLDETFGTAIPHMPSDRLISQNEFINVNDTKFEEIVDQNLLAQEHKGEILEISNVSKSFDELKAVNNFSCKLYKNQIYVLLGHNGAGKSTLINVISGKLDPDSGDITMHNHSLITDKSYLFRNIGLCSQEDIYFDDITVQEHLEIMSELKTNKKDLNEIEDLLEKIELKEKRNSLAKELSGGQKRKLCIAMALIGNSALIMLDEPTSGMDVTARKSLWDFLKNYKSNKIILLTTHSLDEADVLGDRIGIMSEGQLVCCGSSSYLKNQYSCGFNINFLCSEESTLVLKKEFIERLKEFEASLQLRVVSKETLIVNFPVIGDNVRGIFNYIDQIKQRYGIATYTLATTSLEDVFLKLNNDEQSKKLFEEVQLDDVESAETDSILSVRQDMPMNNLGSNIKTRQGFFEQLSMNVNRHAIGLWRNKSAFIIELVGCTVTFFIYSIFFQSSLLFKSNDFNVNFLFNKNDVCYGFSINFINKENYIKNGNPDLHDIYELNTYIDNIKDYQDFLYTTSKYHNLKQCFYLYNNDQSSINVYSYYNPASVDYNMVINNYIITQFLSNEYNIKTTLIDNLIEIPYGSKMSDFNMIANLAINMVSYFLLVGCFLNISAYMITTPLRERLNNIKHLQYLSGMNMLSYWLGIYITDLLKYFLVIIIIFPYLLFKDLDYLYSLIIVVMFVLASLLFTYFASFLFGSEESGQKFYILFTYLAMLLFLGLSLVSNIKNLYSDKLIISWSFLLPSAELFLGFIRLSMVVMMNQLSPIQVSISKIVLNSVISFLFQIVFYGGLLYVFDRRLVEYYLNKFYYSKKDNVNNLIEPNEYVRNERIKVETSSNLSLKIEKLSKTYRGCCGSTTKAVNNLYLGLEPNERFGLLGFNGSGKTTTFKALTDEVNFDNGNIEIFKQRIPENIEFLRNFFGYCPQSNALFDFITVEETFQFYLHGLNVDYNDLMTQFGLIKFKKHYTQNLSGGNKRKLNFAISLLKKPNLILLDEPSTGVDPESRRYMWKNINAVSRQKRNFNIILSTHSMEEAEILCDKIGWMRDGQFICLGNPEKLKLKYSKGYYLNLKFRNITAEDKDEVLYKELDFALLEKVKGLERLRQNEFSWEYKLLYIWLGELVYKLFEYCDEIEFVANERNTFNMLLIVKENNQSLLFDYLLELQIHLPKIIEMNVNLESLKNILTALN